MSGTCPLTITLSLPGEGRTIPCVEAGTITAYMAGDTENEIAGDGQFEEIPITNDK